MIVELNKYATTDDFLKALKRIKNNIQTSDGWQGMSAVL